MSSFCSLQRCGKPGDSVIGAVKTAPGISYPHTFMILFSVGLWILSVLPPGSAESQELRLIRIGTGGLTGVYYPIGKLIAQGLTDAAPGEAGGRSQQEGVQGYIGVAQNSAGSIENIQRVADGEIEAGLVQADVAAWAFQADHAFLGKGRAQAIRAVASLYPEKFQIVVRNDAAIRSINDLKGKRISVDEIGSGTLATMRIVLDTQGMTETDFNPVYLKPVFTHDKMVSGELQGFVMMAGVPMAAVSQLLDIGITLVPILPETASSIQAQYPYLVPGTIPAQAYPGIPEVTTIQVHALLVVSQTLDEDLAYQITRALWSPRTIALLGNGHPQGRSITPETALAGISIPLHPGAQKYYQENPARFKVPDAHGK